MSEPRVRHPQSDASAIAGGRSVRVLEPSPPAINTPPWFADDPTAIEALADAVTPTSAGEVSWADLAADDPGIAEFARAHWLVPRADLSPVPTDYIARRDDLHRLSYAVVAEARRRANSKFGLRWTAGGLGTPFFADDEQVRVDGDRLAMQGRGQVRHEPISTLRAAAEFVGGEVSAEAAEGGSPPLGDPDRPLLVDAEIVEFMADLFGFAVSVLEELRLCGPADEASRVQLWPGHFDAAIDLGDAQAGQRAAYGLSPGDDGHREPYLFVVPSGEDDRSDDYWNDAVFAGASLDYALLRDSDQPHLVALDFFRAGHSLLTA